jgi:hypothetical protein
VLRGVFVPKSKEMAGGRRKLHKGELHNLCSSGDQMKQDEIEGICSMQSRDEKYIKILAGKPEEKRSL